MKRFINISILVLGITFIYLAVSNTISFGCLFKNLFGISCPGCGLTRAFISILNLDFISAIKYNILSIGLFVFLVVFVIFLIKDIILNSNKTLESIIKFFQHNYIFIIVLLIISMVVNNINGI